MLRPAQVLALVAIQQESTSETPQSRHRGTEVMPHRAQHADAPTKTFLARKLGWRD